MDLQPPGHYYPNDGFGGSVVVQPQADPQRKPVRNQYLDTTPESTALRKQTSTTGQDFFSSDHELFTGIDMNDDDNVSDASGITNFRKFSSTPKEAELGDAPDEWLGTDPKLDNGYVARVAWRSVRS